MGWFFLLVTNGHEPESIDDLFNTVHGIYGPMASGKTGEFITRIGELKLFQKRKKFVVRVVKSDLDTRLFRPGEDPLTELFSRNNHQKLGDIISINSKEDTYTQLTHILDEAKQEARELYKNERVVFGVPEAQFMGSSLIKFVENLGTDVYFIWEGLLYNFRGEPFAFPDYKNNMTSLVAVSDYLVRKRAYCDFGDCMRFADHSQRLTPDGEPDHYSSELVVVDQPTAEKKHGYEARCDEHHFVPGKAEAHLIKLQVQQTGEKGISLEDLYDISKKLGVSRQETELIVGAFIREEQMHQQDNNILYRT